MDIMDLASKALVKITKGYGKRLLKKTAFKPIPDAAPVVIRGKNYRAGFAKAEITPPWPTDKTYYIAGHGSGHKMDGVITPVYIHALYLDCGTDEGVLWLSADIIGLTNIETGIIRRKISEKEEFRNCKSINISCTHSHSGIDTVGYWGKANILNVPSDGKDSEYMETLYEKAVEVSLKAYENKVSGKLYSGFAEIPNGLFTKRKIADRHELLSRIRFVPDSAGDEIWIVNIGAHPNSLGGANRKLSGEYPYFMREQIKKESGADVLFGIGAIGGMDAARLDKNDPLNCIKLQAKMFAEAAESIKDEKLLEPEIKFLRRRFYLPVNNYVLMFLAIRGTMSFNAFPFKESETGVAMKTELTYMSFGRQKILLLPGENFVTTVYGGYTDAENSPTGFGGEINPPPLCEIAGDPELIVFGVTNDMTGYVVPPNDFILHPTQPYLNSTKDRFGENHYHETNSMGPDTQKYIAEAFKKTVTDFNK